MVPKAAASTMLEDNGIEVKKSWVVYEVCKNLFVLEVPGYKYDALVERMTSPKRGMGLIVIYMRKGLSDKQKALSIEHERAHIIQFCTEDIVAAKLSAKAESARDEAMAMEAELIFMAMLKNYPPYRIGTAQLAKELQTRSIKRVCGR